MIVRAERRKRLIEVHTLSVAATLLGRLPDPSTVVDGYDGEDDLDESSAYARDLLDPDDSSTVAAVEDGLRAGHLDGWSELDIEESPSGEPGSRLRRLLDENPVIVRTLEAAFVIRLASAVLQRTAEGVEVAAQESAQSTWDVEMTAAITAGVQDGCETIGVSKVRLEVSGEECQFCERYDGRIMDYDHDAGMPPLHTGCGCSIEPLKE